jgi:hypothetical protein
MMFIMSNGSPATFAATREDAWFVLGTTEVQEIPHADLTATDWNNAERLGLDWDLPCFAVAC